MPALASIKMELFGDRHGRHWAPSHAPVLLGSTGLLTCVQLPPLLFSNDGKVLSKNSEGKAPASACNLSALAVS
ncbi:hypothetical protein FCH79_02405 [Pseudomonas koreensis]|nr:hypothetical protein [Pseudomonas koreensis]